MPKPIVLYVRVIDRINRWFGLLAMYLIFAMIAVLFYSSITKVFFTQPLWYLEIAQFLMVAYFLLGGGYALQKDAHVRMDLAYARWSPRTKAAVDAVMVLLLLFYLVMLAWGAYGSTEYALLYGETSNSAWRPKMWPVKLVMCLGIVLVILQTVALFFRDLGTAIGRPID